MSPVDQGSAMGICLRPRGGPSPDPSLLVPRGEGRIRSRFGSLGSRHPSPAQFAGEGPGVRVPRGRRQLLVVDPRSFRTRGDGVVGIIASGDESDP